MTKQKQHSSVDPVLLAVVRAALWARPLPNGKLGTQRFNQLYEQATKQSCVGLFCSALSEGGVQLNKYDAATLMVTLDQLHIDNGKLNAALKSLVELLSSHSVPFLVVKGQLVGSFYPEPSVRCPGDIDFYVPPSHYAMAKELITNQWHVTFEADEEGEQHEMFTFRDVIFEMHYNLMKFYSHRNQVCFDHLLSEAVSHPYIYKVGDLPVPSLSPVGNIVYTFLHLIHHLVELGVGLRQFCDLACLLHAFALDRPQADALRDRLKALGFLKGFKAVGAVLVDCIGLPESRFPFVLTSSDRRFKRSIMQVVEQGGNFGFYGRNHKVRSGMGYFVSAFFVKLRHYVMFYPLLPKEIRARLMVFLPKKVLFGVNFRHSVS